MYNKKKNVDDPVRWFGHASSSSIQMQRRCGKEVKCSCSYLFIYFFSSHGAAVIHHSLQCCGSRVMETTRVTFRFCLFFLDLNNTCIRMRWHEKLFFFRPPACCERLTMFKYNTVRGDGCRCRAHVAGVI